MPFRHLPVGFFFTPENAQLNLVGAFRGASCLLVCGGPSLAAIDKAQFADCWTMAVNNAATTFTPDAAIMCDPAHRFSARTWMNPKVQKFTLGGNMSAKLWDNRRCEVEDGRIVQHWQPAASMVRQCPNVVGFHGNTRFSADHFLHEHSVNWGNAKEHGGGRSTMLAALKVLFMLGFARVYLVGVDFKMDAEHRYGFDEQRSAKAVSNNQSLYRSLTERFLQLQPRFLSEGYHVFNTNPESALRVFPHCPLDDAVRWCQQRTGIAGERTFGLYSSYEDKEREWRGQFDHSYPGYS